MNDKPKVPRHLTTATKRWYTQITTDYVLQSHHLRLLQSAAECWDRAQQARRLLAKEGICFTDRHGAIRPHPATQLERDNKTLFARMLRELALDVESPADEIRPPLIRGNANLKVS